MERLERESVLVSDGTTGTVLHQSLVNEILADCKMKGSSQGGEFQSVGNSKFQFSTLAAPRLNHSYVSPWINGGVDGIWFALSLAERGSWWRIRREVAR